MYKQLNNLFKRLALSQQVIEEPRSPRSSGWLSPRTRGWLSSRTRGWLAPRSTGWLSPRTRGWLAPVAGFNLYVGWLAPGACRLAVSWQTGASQAQVAGFRTLEDALDDRSKVSSQRVDVKLVNLERGSSGSS